MKPTSAALLTVLSAALITPCAALAQRAGTISAAPAQQATPAYSPAQQQGSARPMGPSFSSGTVTILPNPPQYLAPAQSQPFGALPQPYLPIGLPPYIPSIGSGSFENFPSNSTPAGSEAPYYAPTTPYFYGGGGGYSYPYYCNPGYGYNVYPSAYSIYGGVPVYFIDPYGGIEVISNASTIFDPSTGTFYAVDIDPYYGYSGYNPNVAYAPQSQCNTLPQSLSAPFAQIGQAWASGNPGLIDQYLPSGDSRVAIGLNGSYQYSLGAGDFRMMTRDAMSRLRTTDFRVTDAQVRPGGLATAYAMQRYRTASGAAGTVYLAYTLQSDRTASGGFRLIGVNTSSLPQTARQSAWASRSTER